MKGNIRKRGATWHWQFKVRRGDRSRTISGGGFRTRREAEQALAQALVDHEQRTVADSEKRKIPLHVFLRDEWLPLQRPARKPTTYRGYSDIVERRIVPHLGDHRLHELTPGDIAGLVSTLRGTGLSEQSLKNTLVVLRSALEHAVELGWIVRNPAARLPKAARPAPRRTEMRTWTLEQLKVFLAATRDDRLHACFATAAMTGLRRGEVLGLRWCDVDLDTGMLRVQRSRTAAGYDVHEGDTKAGSGRVVALDTDTVRILRRWRARQLEERMAWGDAWVDTGLVFTREDGEGLHPSLVTQAFARRSKAAQVPTIRFHDLRHTHAALMLVAGAHPKVVQERLGHSSIAITLDIYSHLTPGMQEAAASALGALVFGA